MTEPSTRSGTPSSANEENVSGPFGEPNQGTTPAQESTPSESSTTTSTGSFRIVVYPGNNEYAQVPVDPKQIESHEIRQSIRRLLEEE